MTMSSETIWGHSVYCGHVESDVRAMLMALGPGGTTELAERALAHGISAVRASPELGGVSEVAALLGESRQTVGHWIAGRRGPGQFPDPIVEISAGKIWDLKTIREWRENILMPSLESSEIL